jgi:hypothetical protein
MFQEDYILRMVQQLAAAIARIAGLYQGEQHDQALADAERAWGELLGDIPPELAGSIDCRTLAGMLRQPARIRLASQILGEQARALAGQGDDAVAARPARRALELLLEARVAEAAAPGRPARSQRGAPDDAADAAAIRTLVQLVPAGALASRYRALLTGLA